MPQVVERKHIWIGSYRQCLFHARDNGFDMHPIRVVGSRADIIGLRGTLHIHWCGEWWALKEIANIKKHVVYLRESDEDIIETTHT